MQQYADEFAPKEAAFLKAYHYYINVDRHLFVLLGLIRKRTAAIGIISWETPWFSTRFKSSAIYKMSAIGVHCVSGKLQRLIGYKKNFVFLPDCGELAIFCFPEYVRVFDLQSRKIVNWHRSVSPNVGAENTSTIEEQKYLGERGLAPKIYRVDRQSSTYVEELCNGIPLINYSTIDWQIISRVCTKVKAIENARTPQHKLSSDMDRFLTRYEERMEELRKQGIDREMVRVALNELRDARRELRLEGDDGIDLFLSHGDLARRNVLVDKNKDVLFIDWQTLAYRSKDYDIYNFYFCIVQEERNCNYLEQELFDCLNSTLNVNSQAEAFTRSAEFRLFLFVTTIEYILQSEKPQDSTVSRKLAQLVELNQIVTRYREHCRGVLR